MASFIPVAGAISADPKQLHWQKLCWPKMWSDWQGGTFALPPGIDFCHGVVSGLMTRMAGRPPEALAAITIYVNAGRTLRTLRNSFDAYAIEHGPLLLPKLRLIADLGSALPGIPAPPLARVLELGRLISHLIERDPALGAGQSVQKLAKSLSTLMSEMQSEGCGVESLARIDAKEHAAHWQRSLAFLRIAVEFYLTEPPLDGPARQRKIAEIMAAEWHNEINRPKAPVLAVGSTGSHGSTRLFLRALAELPLGTVILPGYDFEQPETVWDSLINDADDHPQARLAALRDRGVRSWAEQPENHRNKLISLALRPAPVTDQWISEGPDLPNLTGPAEGMTLVEAEQPQQEADTIAILIRDAVGHGQPIRLFTADRELVRRVSATLDRWGINIDDSAGEPLGLSTQGLFLRHVAALSVQKLNIDTLITLLKHPITATGAIHGESLRQTRELELHLRRNGPAFPDAEFLREWADRGDDIRKKWAKWLRSAFDIISSAAADSSPRQVPEHVSKHLHLAEILAAGPDGNVRESRLWAEPAGQAADAAMTHLTSHAECAHPMRSDEYADLIDSYLATLAVRSRNQHHPLVRACGPREARTEAILSDDAIVILAGLNEGGWPQAAPPDPWLSRHMRIEAGLTVPERQIGLSAHDFQQAIAAPKVILSRAKRDADSETIPSRWLNRLINLMAGLPGQDGPKALSEMRARGKYWLELANQLARPRFQLAPAPRPAPIPPSPAFNSISVTQVSKLIRDPYAIYAEKVLGLRPLDPLRPKPDAALRGQVLHKVAERLLTPPPHPDILPEALKTRFLTITVEVLAENVPWPAARAFWQARMEMIADQITRDELIRLQHGRPLVVEATRHLPVPGLNLRLTARPDRIDQLHTGATHIYDYKSGSPPTEAQMKHFDKQLLLEAAMVCKGAFPALGPVKVDGISYIQLGGDGATHPRRVSPELIEETWARFVTLVQHYLQNEAGFSARRALHKTTDHSDYDHLSRYGEWGTGDEAVKVRVGEDD